MIDSARWPACWAAVMAVLLLAADLRLAFADKDDARVEKVYPAAILSFRERGPEAEGLGAQVGDLLFAELASRPELYLVDREDMAKLFDEQELSLTGVVNPAEANRVGQLTGAKVLITGSVVQVGANLHLIAKIIGTETSRTLGASAKGKRGDELDVLVKNLADQVATMITEQAERLMPEEPRVKDRVAALRKKLRRGKKPSVMIEISERHVGGTTIDPAAQTEVLEFCQGVGFEVIDPERGQRAQADILITGEGISDFAARHGNLVSARARLEVQAVDRASGRVLAVDRQTTFGVDLSEQIAGKTALQQAAAKIAERLLPELVESPPDDQAARQNRKRGGNRERRERRSDRRRENRDRQPSSQPEM